MESGSENKRLIPTHPSLPSVLILFLANWVYVAAIVATGRGSGGRRGTPILWARDSFRDRVSVWVGQSKEEDESMIGLR